MRASLGLLLGLTLTMLACGSSSPGSSGAACSLNSDCAGGLICAFGECRPPCVTTTDCKAGDSCDTFDGGAACVAPSVDGGTATPSDSGSTAPVDSASVDIGTTIATLGAACSTPGAQGCAGHAQRIVLVCNGTWQVDQTCPAADYCDSRAGTTFATCQPIMPDCANASPGQTACETLGCINASRGVQSPQTVVCGPDLVSQTLGVTCANNACANGGCCTSPTAAVCGGCNAIGQSTGGGTCTELASDPNNCGACGQVCQSNTTCMDGSCQAPPPPPTPMCCYPANMSVTCTTAYAPCGGNVTCLNYAPACTFAGGACSGTSAACPAGCSVDGGVITCP
jgi:hypothetical protein